jgi:hypothetical protein
MVEKDLHVRERPHPVEQKARRLELLALHDERMSGVVGQYGVIELSNESVRRTVPELEDWRDESYARHIIG